MKNKKLSTTITITISIVAAVCILGLFLFANGSMTSVMKKNGMDNMKTALESRQKVIEDYVNNAENQLVSYSKGIEIVNLLEHPDEPDVVEKAQSIQKIIIKSCPDGKEFMPETQIRMCLLITIRK